MANAPIRVGIIGLGAIGQRLIQGFQRFAGDTVIRFVCDVNGDLAAKTASDLGGIPWSTDYRSMLEGDQVDLVYVAVPPKFHHQIALDVIAAGKHILCEKPLALTFDEAKAMTEQVKAAGVVHALNLPLHYSPGPGFFGAKLAEGYIGELRRVEIDLVFPQWPRAWQMTPWVGGREQGGAIREVGPHLFNQVLRHFGPVKRVRANMEYPADPQASENGALGVLELATGHLVSVNLKCNLPRPETVSLTAYGAKGALGMVEWVQPVGVQGQGPLERLPMDAPAPLGLIPNLVKALRGEPADLCGFEAGLAIQGVLDAWERAAESGNWEQVRA